MARSRIVVDEKEAALEEAGDLLQAIDEGAITADDLGCELGDVLLGRKPGRKSPEEVTLFKSVGLSVQDVAAASTALRRAREQGLGREADW